MGNARVKAVLVANVRRLLKIERGESGVSKVMELGFSNGTASRILDDSTSIGIDIIERLAKGLEAHPWQLFVEGLDPERMPSLYQPSLRWPFARVELEVLSDLVGSQAHAVENGILAALATAGISPRKPKSRAA